MNDIYRKYGHRADLMVMFNCRSNKFHLIGIYANAIVDLIPPNPFLEV